MSRSERGSKRALVRLLAGAVLCCWGCLGASRVEAQSAQEFPPAPVAPLSASVLPASSLSATSQSATSRPASSLAEDRPFQSSSLSLGAASTSSFSDSAPKTDDLAQRVAELEKELKAQKAADKKTAEAAARKFVVRPFGRLHVDAGTFSQDPNNKLTVGNAQNGINIRRARLGCEGEGFDILFYRMDFDFESLDQALQTRPIIIDAYLDVQKLPAIGNLRIGHFREPFSLERLDSTHDLPFLERCAPINALAPFRNLGAMAFDWNEDETRTWAYGIFDENTNELGETLHDRAGVALTGRTTWLPYYDEPAQGRYLLHLGASYSFRRPKDSLRRFNQPPEFFIKEGMRRTPAFVDTGMMELDTYHVAGAEVSTVLGSLSLQGEYVFVAGHQALQGTVFLQGGYVEATYWLTGENRNYIRKQGVYGAVTPHSNFFRVETDRGICMGSGAWEVKARLSNIDLNSGAVQGGNMTNVTLGLNWYYAVRCRVMFDYIHSFLDRDNLNSNADILAGRFQYAF